MYPTFCNSDHRPLCHSLVRSEILFSLNLFFLIQYFILLTKKNTPGDARAFCVMAKKRLLGKQFWLENNNGSFYLQQKFPK
jgi:hypothetical protein